MGMSLNVVGFVPPDEKWRRMKRIWDDCKAAKVPVPREVEKFFNDEEPDEAGVSVDLETQEWSDDSREGYELKIEDIPEHVKTLRFYASW